MEDGVGYGYPIASQVIERILAEKEFEQRIATNEQNIAYLLEAGLSPEQIAAMNISKAKIIVLGTGETFDLDALLDMHDIAVAELKAADFAPKNWVEGLGFLKITNFNTHFLNTKFPLGDYAGQTLPEWLMIREEIEVIPTPFGREIGLPLLGREILGLGGEILSPTGDRPTGQIAIGPGLLPLPLEPVIPTGIPVREQVRKHMAEIGFVKGNLDANGIRLTTHGARLSAVEADIEGIIAGLPVVDIPTAREILTSILPLNISRGVMQKGNVTQSLRGWLKDFPVYSEVGLMLDDVDTKIGGNYNLILGNRSLIDSHWTDWNDWKRTVLDASLYMQETGFRKRLEDIPFGVGARLRTLPEYLTARYTNPITGEIKDVYVDQQVGANAANLLRMDGDIKTRLDDMQIDIDAIKGMTPVLGAADLDAILDRLRARFWDIGGESRLFQTWQEEFNSRTIGNGTLLGQLGSRVDGLDIGLGAYDDGFRGDTELRKMVLGLQEEMANMKGAFKSIRDDFSKFFIGVGDVIDRTKDEGGESGHTIAGAIRAEIQALVDGGKSHYEFDLWAAPDNPQKVDGTQDYEGLANAFGNSDDEGLRGSTSIISGDARAMGDFGSDKLGWSPR